MSTTMTQIAREANVSVSLVSRLLREDRSLKVSAATRKRVLETCERLGGVPSLPWTQVRDCHVEVPINRMYARTETIWFINHPVIQYFERHLQALGGRMSIGLFDEEERITTLRKLIEDPKYCQALLLLRGVADHETAELFEQYQFPHLCVDLRANQYHVNTLFADEMGAMRQVVGHLTDLGHQRIGYVGPRNSRYPMFVAAMLEAGLYLDQPAICEVNVPSYLSHDASAWRQEAEKQFTQWIKTSAGASCTAVHCHNDDMGLGVLDAMKQLGMTPGRDLSVIGYDNSEQETGVASEKPVLTTIDNPLEAVGRRAANRLLAQFRGEEEGVIHERIPTRLVVRETTAALTETRNLVASGVE